MIDFQKVLVKAFESLLSNGKSVVEAKRELGIYELKFKNALSIETLSKLKEIQERHRIAKHLKPQKYGNNLS